MIRALPLAAAALALAVVVPASAAPAPSPRPEVKVAVQHGKADDAARGRAWATASPSSRRAADLRRVTVGPSPRSAKHLRFTWRTDVVQGRRPDVARTYSTTATAPETGRRIEVRLVQVNNFGAEAFLFRGGDTASCVYAQGAPRVRFDTRSDTVSLDLRTACLKAATDGATGLRLGRSTVNIERERATPDLVIGRDTAVFRGHPVVDF